MKTFEYKHIDTGNICTLKVDTLPYISLVVNLPDENTVYFISWVFQSGQNEIAMMESCPWSSKIIFRRWRSDRRLKKDEIRKWLNKICIEIMEVVSFNMETGKEISLIRYHIEELLFHSRTGFIVSNLGLKSSN